MQKNTFLFLLNPEEKLILSLTWFFLSNSNSTYNAFAGVESWESSLDVNQTKLAHFYEQRDNSSRTLSMAPNHVYVRCRLRNDSRDIVCLFLSQPNPRLLVLLIKLDLLASSGFITVWVYVSSSYHKFSSQLFSIPVYRKFPPCYIWVHNCFVWMNELTGSELAYWQNK